MSPKSDNKGIGGYLSLDLEVRNELPQDRLYLNSGREGFAYLLRSKKIKKIQLPYYTCGVVWKTALQCGCEIIPYDVDASFAPCNYLRDLPLLYTNYFGLCSKQLIEITNNCKEVYVDNSQAFYAEPKGNGAFWSPRKFFGLPDGGVVWPIAPDMEVQGRAISYNRFLHLIKRIDVGASEAYADFSLSESQLEFERIQLMSNLASALLKAAPIERIGELRRRNFLFLHNILKEDNELNLDLGTQDVPLIYPYKTRRAGRLREILKSKRIFCAKYWPEDPSNFCMRSKMAKEFAETILPIPIDQRYKEEDLVYILECINEQNY